MSPPPDIKTFIPLGTSSFPPNPPADPPTRLRPLAYPSSDISPSTKPHLRHRPNPLPENNPAVFTHLTRALGLSSTLSFYDIYALDSTSHIPRPVHALILICPAAVYDRARTAEDAAMQEYAGAGDAEPVVWIRQTIRHSCGLMGLLHAVLNGAARAHILPGSDLDTLLKAAVPLTPEARSRYLYDDVAVERAHMAAARVGDSKVPALEVEHFGYHYVTFVKGGDGHLWELNGGMKGPVDRGLLGDGEDALSERAVGLGVKTFMDQAGEGEVGFSIVALAPREG